MTLSKRELAELAQSYERLYKTLSSMPSYIGDYYDRPAFLKIEKWLCWLRGKVFDTSDYS